MNKTLKTFAVSSALVIALGFGVASANVGFDSANFKTGPWSSNLNKMFSDKQSNFEVNNVADLFNDIWGDLNTGWNSITRNTSVGGQDPSTGSVSARIELNNDLNGGMSPIIGVNGNNLLSDFTFSNAITGPDSLNKNLANINSRSNFEVNNQARINNDVNLKVNTGKNLITNNTTVGDVTTGDVRTVVSVDNTINGSNGMIMPNTNSTVSASLANDTTGPNSLNENTVDVSEKSNIEYNNEADVENDITLEANSGKNEISGNTTVGDVVTGDIEFNVGVNNTMN